MKSERRHELQHNQLADALGQTAGRVKPYLRLVGGLVVLFAVVGIAYAYITGKEGQRAATGWDEYFEAVNSGDREHLTSISERFAGTSVAPWARIVAADMALMEGCGTLFKNKANARDLLRQAVDSYQTVLNDPRDEMLRQRALFGLGRAHESLATLDDLNKAREDYKKLVKGWPEGVYTPVAKARLADLDKNSTKEFYDWFAKYEPVTAAPPSGKSPEFIEENLEGDIKLPSALDDLDLGDPKGESTEAVPEEKASPPTTESPSQQPEK